VIRIEPNEQNPGIARVVDGDRIIATLRAYPSPYYDGGVRLEVQPFSGIAKTDLVLALPPQEFPS
jgi:hypothetical protein